MQGLAAIFGLAVVAAAAAAETLPLGATCERDADCDSGFCKCTGGGGDKRDETATAAAAGCGRLHVLASATCGWLAGGPRSAVLLGGAAAALTPAAGARRLYIWEHCTCAAAPAATPTAVPSRRRSLAPTAASAPSPGSDRTLAPTAAPAPSPSSESDTAAPTAAPADAEAAWFLDAEGTVSWNGVAELGQTHVVRAHGETRHSPRPVRHRETELLFTPTESAAPSPSPTVDPTRAVSFNLTEPLVAPLGGASWPAGYPSDAALLPEPMSEYYIPNSVSSVDIDLDLGASRVVWEVSLQFWYVTRVRAISVGTLHDDGADEDDGGSPELRESWTWFNASAVVGGSNAERTVSLPRTHGVRYVRVRLEGGESSWGGKWGLRHVAVRGLLDGVGSDGGDGAEEESGGLVHYPVADADVRVVARRGGLVLGVLRARSPAQLKGFVEDALLLPAAPPLLRYSTAAWSATVPWSWMEDGVELSVVAKRQVDGVVVAHRLTLRSLAAWDVHTILRVKFALFGTADDAAALDTFTTDAHKTARDFFGAYTAAELRWADSELVHLPYVVVPTSAGPRRVASEAERRAVKAEAGDVIDESNAWELEPSWSVLKQQLALRLNLANTGRGLRLVNPPDGDSSPYNTGNTVAMGWTLSHEASDGQWQWEPLGYWEAWSAAAWTGWCAMHPGDECGNTLIHELGHSATMAHFTNNAEVAWGIEAEYPMGGVQLADHPTGYDTARRAFRTWYRVDGVAGATSESKRDPMNGGESPNKETCFPPFTAYHAQKMALWAHRTPSLLSPQLVPQSGVPAVGAYVWNARAAQYQRVAAVEGEEPVLLGVPSAYLIGTLSSRLEACQIYPAVFTRAGNVFTYPDPFGSDLPALFDDAAYYVRLRFADGSEEFALIALSAIAEADTTLHSFSLSVALERNPVGADLIRSDGDGYPNVTPEGTVLHERAIAAPPTASLPGVVRVGRGWLGASSANNIVTLRHRCMTTTECAALGGEGVVRWRGDGSSVAFVSTSAAASGRAPTLGESTRPCTIFSDVQVRREEDGSTHALTLFAERFFERTGESAAHTSELLSHPPTDTKDAPPLPPDASFGAHFWLPFEHNSALPSGTYRSVEPLPVIDVGSGTDFAAELRVAFSLSVTPVVNTKVAFSDDATSFESAPYTADGSSIYFLAKRASVGPTERVWWGDSSAALTAPLTVANCSGVSRTLESAVPLTLVAQQRACGSVWQFNAGRGANDCAHTLLLSVAGAPPDAIAWSGCTLKTHPAAPIGIEARRWHDPEANKLLGTMWLEVEIQLS